MSREQAIRMRNEQARVLARRWQTGDLKAQSHCIWCGGHIPRRARVFQQEKLYDRWACKEEAKRARKTPEST